MPIPSRVEVLSWNENQVADLVREHKLLDCVDCIYQRHIDGQKLLHLKENDILYFLEIHNENSRKKLWNIFNKINEKRGGVHGLMNKFEQPPNGRKVSEVEEEDEDSDSFDSDTDSNYDSPEENNPEEAASVSVERRNTIKENLMAAMRYREALKAPAASSDPEDFDSSGYPDPEDIYDTPEDGCGEPDEEMYETPSDESGGGVVRRQSHPSLTRTESDQYIIPDNLANMEDELEYEDVDCNNSEDEPEEYVVPDVNPALTMIPPRPPKLSSKPHAQNPPPSHKSHSYKPTTPKPPAQNPPPSHKLPSYKPTSHKPPAQNPPPSHKLPSYKPTSLKPPAQNPPPSHKSPSYKPTSPKPPLYKPPPHKPATPAQEEPEIENYEAPEPQRAKKSSDVKKPAPGKFNRPQDQRNTRAAKEELIENYVAPEPQRAKKSSDVKKPAPGKFNRPQDQRNTRAAKVELEPETYEPPPLPPDKHKKRKPVIEEPQEDYEIPSVNDDKHKKRKPVIEEPQEDYEIPSVNDDKNKKRKPVIEEPQEDYEIPSVNDDKNKRDIEEPQEDYEIPSVKEVPPKQVSKLLKKFGSKIHPPTLPKKPPPGTEKDKKKKRKSVVEEPQEDYEIPSVNEDKNKPPIEEPQEEYEIPSVKEEPPKQSSNFLKKISFRSKPGLKPPTPPKKAPPPTEDKNRPDIEEPQEDYEIPSVKEDPPKHPRFGHATTKPQQPSPPTKRSPNLPRKSMVFPSASGAPQLPRRPEAQKPRSGSSLSVDGPPDLPSRQRSPSREEFKSDSSLHSLPRKLPPRPPVTDDRTSPARPNGTAGLPRLPGLLPQGSPRNRPKSRQLQDQEWFHGSTRKEIVTETLKKANQDGAYLVRNSSRDPGKITMSVFYKSDIRHLDIPFENGHYRLGKSGTVKFESIVELVEHFTINDVEFSAGGRTTLMQPCVKKA